MVLVCHLEGMQLNRRASIQNRSSYLEVDHGVGALRKQMLPNEDRKEHQRMEKPFVTKREKILNVHILRYKK